MISELRGLLQYLERILDRQRQEQIRNLHCRALNWRAVERLPLVMCYPLPDDAPFHPFDYCQTLDDPEKMLFNQLVYAFDTSIALRDRIDDDLPLTIRPDFGTVLVASLVTDNITQKGSDYPWVNHAASAMEFIDALERPDRPRSAGGVSSGWVDRVDRTYKRYRQILADYPLLNSLIKIVLPDLQGPIDTAAVLRGSDFFMELITDPEMTQKALKICAELQVDLARYFQPYLSDMPAGYSCQQAMWIKGNILIRNDSSIMLSPEMYAHQVARYDSYVLSQMAGGSLHACGSITHLVPEYFKLPECKSLDIGQPELNDIDYIYAQARKGKIPLIRVSVSESELVSGEIMKRFPTGVTLVYHAESFDDACRIMREYRKNTE